MAFGNRQNGGTIAVFMSESQRNHFRICIIIWGARPLTGKNDIETEISNQCGRLISNAIVYYNSAILSRLLRRLETEGNEKSIEALTRISPVAWQHILLNGHYTFQNNNELIDLDTLVAGLKLG